MDIKEIGQYNILSLAYLGDSIWESHIRKHYFMANLKVEDFNNKVKDLVNAKAQSKIYKELLDSLGEELKNICYNRGLQSSNICTQKCIKRESGQQIQRRDNVSARCFKLQICKRKRKRKTKRTLPCFC